MPFISLTRLRLRSLRFLPFFAFHALKTTSQVRHAPGFQTGALLPDRSFTFWTMTAWDSQEDMRRYMTSGSHKTVMPRLMHWCDEASVAHWTQPEPALPTWEEADLRMRASGRASKVRNPSPHHESLTYRAPRTTGAGPITKAKPSA
jgi:heme-degrading monooxygenase HmoA